MRVRLMLPAVLVTAILVIAGAVWASTGTSHNPVAPLAAVAGTSADAPAASGTTPATTTAPPPGTSTHRTAPATPTSRPSATVGAALQGAPAERTAANNSAAGSVPAASTQTLPPTIAAPAPSPTRTAAKTAPKPPAQPSGSCSPASTSTYEQAVFHRLNAERASQGRAALRWNSALAASARAHSKVQGQQGAIGHQFSGEANPATRMRNAGYRPLGAWGENVAYRYPQCTVNAELMEYLMFNEGPHGAHRINILFSQFTDVGIGIYVDANGWMWLTEDFGAHR